MSTAKDPFDPAYTHGMEQLMKSHREVPQPSDGVAMIAAERQRQIDAEGYALAHDREHADESLALAACSYAIPRTWRRWKQSRDSNGAVPTTWPWDFRFWRPTQDDRIRELVKAGALIAAEIDRLASSPDTMEAKTCDPDRHQHVGPFERIHGTDSAERCTACGWVMTK